MSLTSRNKVLIYLTLSIMLFGVGLAFASRNKRRMVKFAESLVGQQEISGNMGFNNKEFQKLMEEVGWGAGDSWCVYLVKLVWYNTAPSWLKAKILKKVSGSSWQTWVNLKDDDSFITSKTPEVGDIVIWKKYKGGVYVGSGHAGFVVGKNLDNTFDTIEGNTSDENNNEGYIVANKTRELDFTNNNGLRLIGFIRFA